MAFATADNVASRLGRDLADSETVAVAWLLDAATAVLADAAGKDDDWAEALTPVPTLLSAMCVELVTRALANPQALVSMQEGLGAHNFSVRFGPGLMLNEMEQRIIRRTVYGTNSASVRVGSIIDDPFVHRHYQSIYLDGDESES